MADPTNPNDDAYSRSPNHVFINGRWQYRESGYDDAAAQAQAKAGTQRVWGESLGTPGGIFGLFSSTPPIQTASIPNAAYWTQLAKDNATRQQATSPYNKDIANQSRPAQLALLAQMQQQMQGPSLAGMQGQRAMAQGGQMALRNAAMGAPGRAGMVGAAQGSVGMAGDVGQARLAEVMRSQAGMGGVAGGLRGNDLRSADEAARAALQAQSIADQSARAYAQMGSGMGLAQDRMGLENFKLTQRIKQQSAQQNADSIMAYIKMMSTIAGGGV